jgi:hypothetical protein
MTNSTIPVNGGAVPKINRDTIMTRAWAIFRETCCYPASSFRALAVTASTLAYAKRGQRSEIPSIEKRYPNDQSDI